MTQDDKNVLIDALKEANEQIEHLEFFLNGVRKFESSKRTIEKINKAINLLTQP